jgi:catechol 2,3-dioxygenase-like lactoylglutathione lyase family enzyme
MKKLTPNLIVDDIEECLTFWVDRLGFHKTLELPHADRLGFVILKLGDIELMLQSRASVGADVPPLAAGAHRSVLYCEVADLAPLRSALHGVPELIAERTTFYGARELIVADPAGNVVFFAAHESE